MATWKTLQDVLKERAYSEHPEHLLFYPLGNACNPMEITYTDLYEEAKRTSRVIQRLKGFQDVVLWFWSVLFAGGLPVLSSPFSHIEEERHKHLRALSTLLRSPICFTRSKFLPLFGHSHDVRLHPIESLLEKSKQLPRLVEDYTINSDTHGFNNKSQAQKVHDEDLLMLMLTSGSTGNAKAVPFTHEQVLAAVSGKAAIRVLPRNRPFLNWIGLDHVAGLLEIHLQALWLGAGQIHVSAADIVTSPATFLDLLSRHRVSLTFAPNFFLAKLVSTVESLQETENPDLSLSSLVCVTSGGEANDIKTCEAASALFSRYGAPHNVLTTGFGMTETCAGAIYNTNCPEYDISRGHTVASLGKCVSGIEMHIMTPEGQLAAPDEPGDLEVRGPVVFKGYYGNDTATKQAFTSDDWFRTGDRGLIDPNGNLNLVGRAKEVININGVKIVAADVQTAIENVLADRVARLVVFSSTTSYTEQVTVAYIPKTFPVPDEEMVDVARLVTQACLIRTATMPLVFALGQDSIPLLPMSTLGKISRIKMARLFEDGEFAADLQLHQQATLRTSNAATAKNMEIYKNGVKPGREAEGKLLGHVAETLGLTPEALDISPETPLFDIGFTSMHVMKLKYHIERHLGIDVPVILILKNPTIRALAAELEDVAHLRHSKPKAKVDLDEPACTNTSGISGTIGTYGNTNANTYDPVVVFRAKGSKTPLWLIHPGVGEVLVFIGLAQCLAADDRPVFALRAAGFEPDHQRFESIKQTVDVYTAAIRQRQPRGPYALAGYSYGTMLAFETAKRLGADGDEVPFLGSFNLPPHIKQRIRTLNWNVCLLHLSHFLGLVPEHVSDTLEVDPTFRNMPLAEAMARVFDIADKPRWDELQLDTNALARWVHVAFGLQRMASNYDPSGQVNNLDVFYCTPLKAVAKSREVWLRDYLSRWVDFVHESPRFHAVQGEHYTMINADHVVSFTQTLMETLKERGV